MTCGEYCFVSYEERDEWLHAEVPCELGEEHPGSHRYTTLTGAGQALTLEWASRPVVGVSGSIDGPPKRGRAVTASPTTSTEEFNRDLEVAFRSRFKELRSEAPVGR